MGTTAVSTTLTDSEVRFLTVDSWATVRAYTRSAHEGYLLIRRPRWIRVLCPDGIGLKADEIRVDEHQQLVVLKGGKVLLTTTAIKRIHVMEN